MSPRIPLCRICGQDYCTQACLGPTPRQRVPDYPAPELEGLSDAARASIREKCVNALVELEREAASASPSPVSLRTLASTVDHNCPPELSAYVPDILDLTEGLAGLWQCQRRLRNRTGGADHSGLVRGELGACLRNSCLDLREALLAASALAPGSAGGG